MLFRVILALFLVLMASSGSVSFPIGLTVQWTVSSPSITFTITASNSLASSYDYWGIGFKAKGTASDMVNSNIWVITKSGTFFSAWSLSNSAPSSSNAGTAVLKSFTQTSAGYVTVVTRNLSTNSSKDFQLAQGSSYLLTYGYGSMSGSRLLSHLAEESGSSTITLEASVSTGSSSSNNGSGSSTSGSNGPAITSTSSGSVVDPGFETSESAPSSSDASYIVPFSLSLVWL